MEVNNNNTLENDCSDIIFKNNNQTPKIITIPRKRFSQRNSYGTVIQSENLPRIKRIKKCIKMKQKKPRSTIQNVCENMIAKCSRQVQPNRSWYRKHSQMIRNYHRSLLYEELNSECGYLYLESELITITTEHYFCASDPDKSYNIGHANKIFVPGFKLFITAQEWSLIEQQFNRGLTLFQVDFGINAILDNEYDANNVDYDYRNQRL